MRTTVDLDHALLTRIKELAVRQQRTMSEVIEEAVRLGLARGGTARRGRPPRLFTVGGTGPVPGVDLDDSAALADITDGLHSEPRPV